MGVLDGGPLAAGGGLLDGGLDQLGGLGLLAAERREHERAVWGDARPGRLRDRIGLGDQQRAVAKSPPSATAWPSTLTRHGEHLERPRVAGELDLAGGDRADRCRSPTRTRRRPSPASPSGAPPRPRPRCRRTRWSRAAAPASPAARPSVKTSAKPSSSRSTDAGAARLGAPLDRPRDLAQAGGVRQLPREQRRAPGVEVGLAREPQVERLERSRGPEQQRRSVAAAVLREGDLGVQQVHAGPPELVQRPGLGGRRAAASAASNAPACRLACGRRQHALGAAGRLERQLGRPPQERRRGGQPAASLRPSRRPLELGGHVLVRARRWPAHGARRGDPARAPLGHLRQRAVHALALGIRGRPVDGRPHQRMAEAHLRADVQQPAAHRGARAPCRRSRAASPRATSAPGRRPAPPPRPAAAGASGRQLVEPPQEALLDPARQRQQLGQAEPAGQLRAPTARAAAPAARADCRASRRRSGPGRARRAGPG